VPLPDIIAIGASAGGVEALIKIAASLPSNLRAAILVVIHVAPDSAGLMPSILNRSSLWNAIQPQDGTAIEHGNIYIAPPDHHMVVETDERIRIIQGPKHNRHRPAIDPLFRTVARVYDSRAIGVILTGFLSDGSSGLAMIKNAGGVAIVQDPNDALVPSMPRRALEQLDPDYCLPLNEIPAVLSTLVKGEEAVKKIPPAKVAAMTKEKKKVEKQEQPSPFTCPECHGTIWETRENGEVRFECRVGHSFSPESMAESNDEDVERALWAALRTLEESASLDQRLADLAAERNRSSAHELYSSKAKERKKHAQTLRDLLMGGASKRLAPIEETRGDQELEKIG
jgi:two-component system, chemotaxis family, protein-glutamate methylesterase/glutaminase